MDIRDGPLENLWGGGGMGEVQKKYSCKGKLNEKNSYEEFDDEKNSCGSKIPHLPHNFSNCSSLRNVRMK